MIIDFSGPSSIPGVIIFPDVVFPDAPRDDPIGESVSVEGCGAGTSVTVCGSVDD